MKINSLGFPLQLMYFTQKENAITTRIVYKKGLACVKVHVIEFHREMNEIETEELIKCQVLILYYK